MFMGRKQSICLVLPINWGEYPAVVDAFAKLLSQELDGHDFYSGLNTAKLVFSPKFR
jgi:hypothetical protein